MVANLSLRRNFGTWVESARFCRWWPPRTRPCLAEKRRDHVCMSQRTCSDCERGPGLIMVETRGLTFQRDRWHTRLAHLRDFELWPETTAAVRQTQEVTQVKRRVVGRHEGPVDGMAEWPRFGIADGGEQVEDAVTRNVRVACEPALIISYPELNFPSGWSRVNSILRQLEWITKRY